MDQNNQTIISESKPDHSQSGKKSKAEIKVLITGGHMTPAFAVLAEMQSRGFRSFLWVGHKYNRARNNQTSPEFQTVEKLGIKFVDLKAGKLNRAWGGDWQAGLVNLAKIPWGFIQSIGIILKYKPDLIVSFGGYIALPIVIVGKLLGKQVVTHEQTAVTGLTNQILPKFADKVLISWPSSQQFYPAHQTILTGNPLRPEIFKPTSDNYHFDNSLPVVYITGGNQGSHKINQAVFAQLNELLQVCNIIHQTGNSSLTNDSAQAESLRLNLPADMRSRYIPKQFIFPAEIGEVFAKADLVVARSGANTTYEILALGKPTIFIPIPWVTHNEQFLNAKIAADTGIATILTEAELSGETLLKTIFAGLEKISQSQGFNDQPLTTVKQVAQSQIKLDAHKLIVDEIESLGELR